MLLIQFLFLVVVWSWYLNYISVREWFYHSCKFQFLSLEAVESLQPKYISVILLFRHSCKQRQTLFWSQAIHPAWAGSFSTPPGWDSSPSLATLPPPCFPDTVVPWSIAIICTSVWKEAQRKWGVFFPKTLHNDAASTSIWTLQQLGFFCTSQLRLLHLLHSFELNK